MEALDLAIAAEYESGNLSDTISEILSLDEAEIREELSRFNYHDTDYEAFNECVNQFFSSMDDDFSTPKAIAAIFPFIKQSNKDLEDKKLNIEELLAVKHFFADVSEILGIDFLDYADETSANDEALLEIIADVRAKLRAEKQYELSDDIRDKLVELGIEVSD